MLQIVLTYSLGIYTQRVGDRNNDCQVSYAGRYAFGDWFYGFRHPLYREIEYRDLLSKSIMPEKVQNQLSQNLSFSNSKTPGRHQGGDFLLGQKVQRQKLIAPKGVVEKSVWHKVSRSIDKLDKIYSNASSILNLQSETKTIDLLNLSEKLKMKRDKFWELHKNGISLNNMGRNYKILKTFDADEDENGNSNDGDNEEDNE